MRRVIIHAAVWLLASLLFVTPLTVCATEVSSSTVDRIIEQQCEQSSSASVQEWLDGALTNSAGQTSEWFVLSLAQSGREYDFTAYRNALTSYAKSHEVSAVTRQKYALLLAATGSTDGYIASVMNETIGTQGIMSLVYGLHLLANGFQSDVTATDAVIGELLLLQLGDGGWALKGETADTDVTAMVVQSLAPFYETIPAVTNAVDRALLCLCARQTENGDAMGMNGVCAESTAQILTALSSLGIDCQTDDRFIKNGNTLLDGLQRHETDSGYSHAVWGQDSLSATSQALYALVAYQRMLEGKNGLYDLDLADTQLLSVETEPSLTPVTSVTAATAALETVPTHTPGSYKPIATLIVLLIGGVFALAMVILKKNRMKNWLVLAVAVAVAVTVVWLTTFESAQEYYGTPPTAQHAVGTVTLSVDSLVLKENGKTFLPAATVPLEEGDTVYDVLVKAAKEHSLQLDVRSGYVTGIAQLYEFDYGDLSGWVFFVNGKESSVGCDAYKLADGDRVEWRYTCELGADLT